MNLTYKVKLLPTVEQNSSLLRTMETFNKACNYVSSVAWRERKFGQVVLHRLCYRHIRDAYSLSAQMAVRAIGKVAESYKAERRRLHRFRKRSAMVYDQRILSFRGLKEVSILSLEGRLRVPIVSGDHARLGERPLRGQADLVYCRGKLYLCVCTEVPEEDAIEPESVLGVDMGLVNLATTSDGERFAGREVDAVREHTARLKAALQKRGTKSAKRHLKRLSGREARFKRNVNHVISRRIVREAKDTCRAIALEDLNGIRGRTTVRKADRQRFRKWAFGQMRQFIEYKSALAGVPVFVVDPRNSSRECSVCGHVSKSNRKSQSLFSCTNCGYITHTDFNAAVVIAARAPVNAPIAVHAHALSSLPPGTASPVL